MKQESLENIEKVVEEAKETKKELIVCIINNGFSDLVMTAAKNSGARGGTILHGRGTGNPSMEKFFGIAISPEKEIIIIVADSEVKEAMMEAIYKDAGLDTKGQGIVFSLPVSDFVTKKEFI